MSTDYVFMGNTHAFYAVCSTLYRTGLDVDANLVEAHVRKKIHQCTIR